jgi:hypothetical protein
MADEPPVLEYSGPAPREPLGDRAVRWVCVVFAVPFTLSAVLFLVLGVREFLVRNDPCTLASGICLAAFAVGLWHASGWIKPRRR